MALLPHRGDSGFTLGGFLILAALGTFLWKGAPLESFRPSSDKGAPYEHNLDHKIPARLWQDPFKAVSVYEQMVKSAEIPIPSHDNHINSIFNSIKDKPDGTKVTVLMVQLHPGAYAELEENRRRRRFAILSGLGDENFVPRNPEALNVFYHTNTDHPGTVCSHGGKKNTDKQTTKAGVGKETTRHDTANKTSKECFPIPYEWYDEENPDTGAAGSHHVLVLWLDASRFVESPLTDIQVLLERLVKQTGLKGKKFSATLLGPERSDALRNLVNSKEVKAQKWLHCESNLTEFNIISSTATVDDDDLIQGTQVDIKQGKPLTVLQNKINNTDCENSGAKKTMMNFLRSIRSDKDLIEKLSFELIDKRSISPKNDYVIVISEWDTYFGRSLPRAFIEHFCSEGCGNEKKNKNIVRYSYQRGIDGIIAGKQNTIERTNNKIRQKGSGLSSSIDATTVRRPVGTGQFDYLRRLATDIQKKDREWRLSTGHGVRAVVLLGSDVYDKLLIMRALRPALPGTLFATTDLDVQLLHPAEYNWTRSLIVASTYDLALSLPVSVSTMPFRDSYQTSMYLAARMSFNTALWCKGMITQELMDTRIPPQLMEVGRQRLIPLPGNNDRKDTWNIKQVESFAGPVSTGLLIIVGLGMFAFHQLRPGAGREVMVLSVLILLFFMLGYKIQTQIPGGEPLTLFAGASIWPAEYIRVFSVVLSLTFIWSVVQRLNRNWDELGYRYFWDGAVTDSLGVTVKQLFVQLGNKLRHPVQSLGKIKLTNLLSLVMVAILMLVMSKVLPEKLPLDEKIINLCMVWGVLFAIWWLCIYGHKLEKTKILSVNKRVHNWWMLIFGRILSKTKVLSINEWVNKWRKDVDREGADHLWRSYGMYGASDQRFLRTMAYILLYFAFASILFSILGSPSSPVRGKEAFVLDKMILGFSVLSMLLLLFLVADAARLCICWVDLMRKHDVDWSKSKLKDFEQCLRLPKAHAIAWIKIHLIGERTSEVTRLIYYPVLIILLMLLARSTYFDNWDFPQALAIIIGLNFMIALGSVVRLNFVAQSVREEILRNLQNEKLAADREEAISYTPNSIERQELIHQLESLRIGAFLRIWEQPPVRATLMLLGGVALTYAEYISVIL